MNKKPKILLISYLFAPNNAIGAVRPTKIAERLIKKGYDVDIFTYGYTGNDSFEVQGIVFNKYMVNDKPVAIKNAVSSGSGKKDNLLVYKLKRHYFTYLSSQRDKFFVEKFKKVYQTELCKNNYDIVFTSFGPLASIKAGLYVKKMNPEIKWICDFRDPIVVDFTPELYKPYFQYMQEISCKKADAIIAVSEGYLERVCKGRYKDKSYMIPNGFDLNDKPESGVAIDYSVLKLAYVGALYSGKRDLSPVFKAIKELSSENKIDLNKVVFEYAGSDFMVLKQQAEIHNVEEILHDNGRLTRSECLDLQFSSHSLVLSTWNDKKEFGVFPGKFLEYMLIGRPIVSVVDGDLKNSEVTAVINEGNFGVSYESVNDKEDFKNLKNYIHKLYVQVIEKQKLEFSPKEAVLERYNYSNIMERIESLLQKM